MILLETIQRDCPPDLSGGFFFDLSPGAGMSGIRAEILVII
jgi:hypothetical protein